MPRVIAFNLSGHGNFDLAASDSFLQGRLENYEYPAQAVATALNDFLWVAVAT